MCVCARASRCKFACTSIEIKIRTRARPRTRIDLNSLLRRNETHTHMRTWLCDQRQTNAFARTTTVAQAWTGLPVLADSGVRFATAT